MRNDLITEARATEIINEVSEFLKISSDRIKKLAIDIQAAVEMGLTDAGYELALLYAVVFAISCCEKDLYEAIARKLYIIKNNPTEKVTLEITKEGAE